MIENKETFYVYFGDELCPWCRSVIEKFIEVAKKNDVKKVYYVKIWDDDHNEITLQAKKCRVIRFDVKNPQKFKPLIPSLFFFYHKRR